MRSVLRTLSFAACLATVATLAEAQSSFTNNPASRGSRSSFSFDSNPAGARSEPLTGPLGAQSSRNALSRPTARFGPVTPVPEPSEWAMMLVGLAIVGYIVRRGSRR
jgi:hypothetical protein